MRRDAAGWMAAGGRVATAATGVPDTRGVSRLERARRQMADEAAVLRAAQGAPEAERARLLADLATRIEALLTWLAADLAGGARPGPARLTELTALARKLRACDGPAAPNGGELDALWQEAIRVLTGFADGTADPAARHAFWKRPR